MNMCKLHVCEYVSEYVCIGVILNMMSKGINIKKY